MRLTTIILTLYILLSIHTHAQTHQNEPGAHMRISLLTLGPGTHTLEGLGHVAIRIIDSSRTDDWRDVVFNYGTFNFTGNNFIAQTLTGNLNFYLSVFRFDTFMKLFVAPQRSLTETEWHLTTHQKLTLAINLQHNAKPENMYYHYNFFADNCATRIFQILKNTFGPAFHPPPQLKVNGRYLSYYSELPYHTLNAHWQLVGAQLLFQTKMQQPLTTESAAAFPLLLALVLQNTSINGIPLSKPPITIQKQNIPNSNSLNQPLILSVIVLLLTILGIFYPATIPGKVMQPVVFITTGCIGCILLWAWLIANYAGTENNMNLLWALPPNIFVPFLPLKFRKWYAASAALVLGIFLCWLVVNAFKGIAPELIPLIAAETLLFISLLRKKSSTTSSTL